MPSKTNIATTTTALMMQKIKKLNVNNLAKKNRYNTKLLILIMINLLLLQNLIR